MSPSLELQGAILTRLAADGSVTALIGSRIYDSVPGGALFPYISFGPTDELSDDADCITGFDIDLQIDVWSRKPGFVEAKQISDAVRAALHESDLPLTENALVSLQHRQTRIFRDPDGLTSHAAITFNAFVEQPSGD